MVSIKKNNRTRFARFIQLLQLNCLSMMEESNSLSLVPDWLGLGLIRSPFSRIVRLSVGCFAHSKLRFIFRAFVFVCLFCMCVCFYILYWIRQNLTEKENEKKKEREKPSIIYPHQLPIAVEYWLWLNIVSPSNHPIIRSTAPTINKSVSTPPSPDNRQYHLSHLS
jgi:hypothetical protein